MEIDRAARDPKTAFRRAALFPAYPEAFRVDRTRIGGKAEMHLDIGIFRDIRTVGQGRDRNDAQSSFQGIVIHGDLAIGGRDRKYIGVPVTVHIRGTDR